MSKIFLPFYTTKEQGTGLGLSMVYNIVQSHEGFVNVYSEQGIGTSFGLFLPCHGDLAIGAESKEERLPAVKGEGTVLVVDDEAILRTTLASILAEFGFTVLAADNGEDGVRMYAEHHADIRLVMLDMVMPKLSGKEAYCEIKKIDANAKIVLMSGFKQDERIRSTIELGVAGFLQKPFDTGSLVSVLAKALDT